MSVFSFDSRETPPKYLFPLTMWLMNYWETNLVLLVEVLPVLQLA